MTILHTVGDWLRAYLLMVPPGVVRGLFLALPVFLINDQLLYSSALLKYIAGQNMMLIH